MGNEQSKVVPLIRRDDERSLRELIAEHGTRILAASYEHKDNYRGWPSLGAYLLRVAVECEAVNCLKVISQHVDVNTKNKVIGSTVLHYGVRDDKLKACRTLVELGASVNARNDNGITPLHHATLHNHSSIASFLLSRGAEVNSQNMNGFTPMHHACLRGYLDSVKLLLDAGADATSIKNYFGKTAADYADEYPDVAEYLKSVADKPSAADTCDTTSGHPPPPPQQVNPWESPQYLGHLSTLRDRVDADFIHQCYSRKMITRRQYIDIRAVKVPSEQKEDILVAISGAPKNFTTFLDILRSHEINQYSDILEDLESIPRS